MNLRFYKFICTTKQFRSDDYDRSRTISDFFILFLCEIDEYTSSGMFN